MLKSTITNQQTFVQDTRSNDIIITDQKKQIFIQRRHVCDNTITNQANIYVPIHFWDNRITKQTNTYTDNTKAYNDTVCKQTIIATGPYRAHTQLQIKQTLRRTQT